MNSLWPDLRSKNFARAGNAGTLAGDTAQLGM